MTISDLLFRLPPHIFVRIKFYGNPDPFCFTTGNRTTGKKLVELMDAGLSEVKVNEIIPLWHAQELYIKCM